MELQLMVCLQIFFSRGRNFRVKNFNFGSTRVLLAPLEVDWMLSSPFPSSLSYATISSSFSQQLTFKHSRFCRFRSDCTVNSFLIFSQSWICNWIREENVPGERYLGTASDSQ